MKFKKIFAGLLSLAAALFAVCAITVCAGAEKYYDYSYIVLNDGTVELTQYEGNNEILFLPETINDMPITSIGKNAFTRCTTLSSVTIPESVTNIGDCAFMGCTNLTSINIPHGVTKIGEETFSSCSSLNSIDLPDGLKAIGDGAFYRCKSLWRIYIPDSVISIGIGAFASCENLVDVNIPNNITYLPENIFGFCTNLTSIDIPNSVTSIGADAFVSCDNLVWIKIPDTVKSIGEAAFDECLSLESITLPKNLSSLEKDTFRMCEKLISINIPDGVTSIGDWAFGDCISLASIKLPDGVKSIGDWAFNGCSSLTSINIPDSVISIGTYAFSETPFLSSQTTTVKYAGNWAVDCDYDAATATMTIKNGTIGIANNAFYMNKNLTSISIPDSVKSIGDLAFNGCSSLTSINFPDSVTNIGEFAFSGTPLLYNQTDTVKYVGKWAISCDKDVTTATIKSGTMGLADKAFSGCKSLASVTIPDSMTSIGNDVFNSCESLKDVYYSGSKAQWDKIAIDEYNEDLLNATIHYGKHISADPIIENEIPTNCGNDGSYDEVVYCSDCGEELSRTTVTVPAAGKHTPAESVKENEVEPTCGADGSYDEVVYCSVCDEEISRDTVTIPATGEHTYVDKVVEPTYDAEGYTEHTCSVCGYSFKDTYTAKKTLPSPSSVTGLKLKGRAGDALRISWTKNTSADGYIIDMKDGSKWVRVAKITKNSTVEYRKDKLKAGTAYTFRVKAYKMDGKTALYSGYTSISARTNPSAVSGLKLKGRAGDALRIAWTKNTSADGYIIEMKVNGAWTRVGKVTKNSTVEFRKAGLKAGTAYSFRVKSYKMSGKTALYSATKTISVRTNPSAVSGLKLKNSAKNAVRLSWTKNTSADGYIVEMKVGGVWKRAGKITSNSTVEFKKSGLKSNTSYTFRVKSYKMSGKTALYSGYTTITVKTK